MSKKKIAVLFFDLDSSGDMDGLLRHVTYFNKTGQWAPVPVSTRWMRVVANAINVRAEPAANAKIVASLPRGHMAEVVNTRDGWHQIRQQTELLGWVSAKYVELIDD